MALLTNYEELSHRPYEDAKELAELVTLVRVLKHKPFQGMAFTPMPQHVERVLRACFNFETADRPKASECRLLDGV